LTKLLGSNTTAAASVVKRNVEEKDRRHRRGTAITAIKLCVVEMSAHAFLEISVCSSSWGVCVLFKKASISR